MQDVLYVRIFMLQNKNVMYKFALLFQYLKKKII